MIYSAHEELISLYIQCRFLHVLDQLGVGSARSLFAASAMRISNEQSYLLNLFPGNEVL